MAIKFGGVVYETIPDKDSIRAAQQLHDRNTQAKSDALIEAEAERFAARQARKQRKMDRTAKAIVGASYEPVAEGDTIQIADSPGKALVSLRLDKEVIDFFKALGPGYTTRINDFLVKAVREGADKWLTK